MHAKSMFTYAEVQELYRRQQAKLCNNRHKLGFIVSDGEYHITHDKDRLLITEEMIDDVDKDIWGTVVIPWVEELHARQ